MDTCIKIREKFLAAMAELGQAEGMPPIAGRLFAVLVFDGGTVSFADLVERLNVSRASVSTSARYLEARGLIRRVSREGSRAAFYELPDHPYQGLFAGISQRAASATEMITNTRDALSETKDDGTRQRLTELAAFYNTLHHMTAQASARLDGDHQ